MTRLSGAKRLDNEISNVRATPASSKQIELVYDIIEKMAKTQIKLLVAFVFIFVLVVGSLVLNRYWYVHQRDRVVTLISRVQAIDTIITMQTDGTNLFLKILLLSPRTDVKLARDIARYVEYYSKLHSTDPNLILAMIRIESNFNPDAESRVGASGLMQLMDHWIKVFNITGDLRDPETNIKYGVQIFGFYLEMYQDMEHALAAYNRGPSKVDWDLIKDREVDKTGYAKKVMEKYKWLRNLDDK